MNIARKARRIEPLVRRSPWPGYEHYRGYAVMNLPFSSGHLLGLRVFPQNDFAPYLSVWHRSPDGAWSIHSDGPSLETTCPRWWGPALEHADLKSIRVQWPGPNELRVEMQEPRLTWTMQITAPLFVRFLNAASAALPLWTWKPSPLLRLREWLARRVFAMGDLRFSFLTPRGQSAIVMPEQMFFIDTSDAELNGTDLGDPVRLDENPKIGGVALPTRPSFVIASAFARVDDEDEYERTRKSVASTD